VGEAGGLSLGDVAYTVVVLMVDVFFEGGEYPVHFYQSVSCHGLLVQPLLNGADIILLIGEKFTHEPMLLLFEMIWDSIAQEQEMGNKKCKKAYLRPPYII
jgi:hypothetical protein